ncbi:MAG: hypothetical protein HY047_02090 [Acidobacteria bacterium]|nr:hypothetical protein [Acidobacteriota bacterium]
MSTNRRSRACSIASALLAMLVALPAAAQTSGVGSTTYDHQQAGGKVLTLARDLELRLAVNALPRDLRASASVLVLEPTGYVKAQQGTNPFTCLVSRRGGNFYPVCFDEEGTRTILPAFADDATMRLKGATDEDVERQIAKGFEEGLYRPPSRPGIAYMLSPATYMLENGALTRNFPHTMFYAPFLTDSDIGGLIGRTAFVDRPGPHGMIIVLAGQKEREALLSESQALVDEVE